MSHCTIKGMYKEMDTSIVENLDSIQLDHLNVTKQENVEHIKCVEAHPDKTPSHMLHSKIDATPNTTSFISLDCLLGYYLIKKS